MFYYGLGKLAHNVLSMRRSSPPFKANRRFAVGWNVGEEKPCGGQSPNTVFRTPRARIAPVAHTVCYAIVPAVFHFFIIFIPSLYIFLIFGFSSFSQISFIFGISLLLRSVSNFIISTRAKAALHRTTVPS